MKTMILLFLIICTISHAETPKKMKIILLTSFMETKDITRTENEKLEKDIEIIFRKTYENSVYDIEITHLASPLLLWNSLNDQQAVGLFWVSHAKESHVLASAINDPGSILDAYGNNVKDLFKKTTPSLRFLSVIGCETQSILDNYKIQGFYSNNLIINSYNKKITAKHSFKKSLKFSKKILLDEERIMAPPIDKMDETKVKLRLEGLNPLANQLIKIELGNEIIAVHEIDSDSLEIFLESEWWNKIENKNIKVTLLGEGPLPHLSIEMNGIHLWKLFTKDGKAIGREKNLYLFSPN